jgi:hypothetical protein
MACEKQKQLQQLKPEIGFTKDAIEGKLVHLHANVQLYSCLHAETGLRTHS